ncbi:hypothetical protein ACRS5S_17655 [Nocardia asiatica]|nr:hypothetical protein [Nocardia asiatica]
MTSREAEARVRLVDDERREVDTTRPKLPRALHGVGCVLREPQPSRT